MYPYNKLMAAGKVVSAMLDADKDEEVDASVVESLLFSQLESSSPPMHHPLW